MAIPKDKELHIPVLRIIAEAKGDIYINDLVSAISDEFNLSSSERQEYLPGRRKTKPNLVIRNRIDFVRASLKQANWIGTPEVKGKKKAGYSIITDEGLKAIEKINREHVENISRKYLRENSPSYRRKEEEIKARRMGEEKPDDGTKNESIDMEEEDSDVNLTEKIENVFKAIQSNLQEEILQRIMESDPELLEKLSIELMNAMGYGEKVDSTHTGKSGDGGVDAIVKEDSLGLGVINIQTKRYTADNHIQPAAIREFSGTLRGGVNKGVFITTSSFTKGAKEEAKLSNGQIILIDGNELARLMIKHGVGVKNTREPMNIQEVDDDYFEDL